MAKKSPLLSLIKEQMNIKPTSGLQVSHPSMVPPELEDDIKRMLSSPPLYEVEVSFGTFKEGGDYFIPGAISVWQYSVLNKTLRDLVEKGVALLKDEKTDVEVMQNLPKGDQRAFYRRVKRPNGSYIWENKKRDRSMIENRFWGYRISRSEEIVTDNPPFSEESFVPNFVRHRRRLTFTFPPGSDMSGFQFDLSHIVEDVTRGSKAFTKTKYEIEIERVAGSNLGIDILFVNFANAISFAIKSMQGQSFSSGDEKQLLSLPERLQISKIHGKIYPSKHENPYKLYKDYWNKPINIEVKDLLNLKLDQFSVTLKLDGVRRFIMISNDAQAIYSLSPPDDSWKIGSHSNLKFTLLDTELYENDYYVFDILYYDGADVGGATFRERLSLATKAVEAIAGKLYGGSKITVKQFYMPPTGFYENVRYAFDKMTEDKKIRYDGLILQPPGPYKNNDTRKWKPESQMTIDFHVSKKDLPSTSGSDEYALWVGINKDLVRFEGTRRYPYHKTVTIPDGRFEGMSVEGMIIEFSWDESEQNFIPHRLREDRDRPNAKSTAEDVWRDIMDPVSRAVMEGDTLDVMRKYHNDIKRKMLTNELSQGDIIIDIGSGKGGDLSKWKDIGLSKVYVIEPSQEHLNELESRAKEMGLENLYQIVRKEDGSLAGAEDGEVIETVTKSSKITAVVAFFSLTFFGKNKDLFKKLIESIDRNLPEDGKLIGIVMDGERVSEELAKQKVGEGEAASIVTPAYSLEQITRFSDKYEEGRNEIQIDIAGAATVHKQTEWLFYYNLFKSALEKKGIREERTQLLNKGPIFEILPKDSQRFCSMYRTFVFKRSDRRRERATKVSPEDIITFPQASDLYKEDLSTIQVERDRSSFVRAVIRAFDRQYFEMDAKEREIYINKIRGMLSRKAKDLELYASLNGGEIEKEYTDAELYEMGITNTKMKPSIEQQSQAEELGQLVYRLNVADNREHLNHQEGLDLMAKVLMINIIVLKGNGEPIIPLYGMTLSEYKESLKGKKTVVVVYDGVYYTLLAKKVDDDIYTLFESNNTLIKKILE